MNAGYNGRTQGEMKLRKPAPNARKIFKSVAITLSPSFFFSYRTKSLAELRPF